MRFMIIVKATKDSEAGVMPNEECIARMATYHEELAKAGALLDASGLQASSKGWRIKYSGDKRTFVDGPFAETKELIAGYTMIRRSRRKKRSNGRNVFLIQPWMASKARSRCASCSSWRTLVPAKPLNAFARWVSARRSRCGSGGLNKNSFDLSIL
jgi:hypothetical protein